MSLSSLANMCSHLQNASRARLGLTSVPLTKNHLAVALGLQRQGIVSTVDVGGSKPPPQLGMPSSGQPDHDVLGAQTDNPSVLANEPWRCYPDADPKYASKRSQLPSHIPENPADRRIWIGLKYWQNQPVLSQMTLVSKPKRKVSISYPELLKITRGMRAGTLEGLKNPGECIFLRTDQGLMEARECVDRRLGGQLMCRVL